jgi:hypothetical protein
VIPTPTTDQFTSALKYLGWQGGTVHQVRAEIETVHICRGIEPCPRVMHAKSGFLGSVAACCCFLAKRPSLLRNDCDLPSMGPTIQGLLQQEKTSRDRTTNGRRGTAIHACVRWPQAKGSKMMAIRGNPMGLLPILKPHFPT